MNLQAVAPKYQGSFDNAVEYLFNPQAFQPEQSAFVELKSNSKPDEMPTLNCIQSIYDNSLEWFKNNLFPKCVCEMKKDNINIENLLTRFNVTKNFAEPESNLTKLLVAIFEGDSMGAKSLIDEPSIQFGEKLNATAVSRLSFYLGEHDIHNLIQEKFNQENRKPSISIQTKVNHCERLSSKKTHRAALWVAISQGNVNEAVDIVNTARIDLESPLLNSREGTPIDLAIKLGDEGMSNALLNSIKDSDVRKRIESYISKQKKTIYLDSIRKYAPWWFGGGVALGFALFYLAIFKKFKKKA